LGPILPSLFQGPTSPAVGSILGLPDRTRVRPLKLSSWIVLSNSLSHVRGLLYFKVGLQFTYFYRDILVCRGSFIFISRWVPLGRSRVERLCLVGFLGRRVVKLLSHLGQSEWLWCSVGARRSSSPQYVRMGTPVRIGATCPFPRGFLLEDGTPVEGRLTWSGGLALSQSLA